MILPESQIQGPVSHEEDLCGEIIRGRHWSDFALEMWIMEWMPVKFTGIFYLQILHEESSQIIYEKIKRKIRGENH